MSEARPTTEGPREGVHDHFMVERFGWTRRPVTSGNALSKLVTIPTFGLVAGWMVDRFGPRRIMMAGILVAGVALVGLGNISTLGMSYFFRKFSYVRGGPLPKRGRRE